MAKSDIFWTDLTQAQERLTHSVVLYDNKPAYVIEVGNYGEEDRIPRALITFCEDGRDNKTTRKMLNSPKFARFRELPKIGWMNPSGEGSRTIIGAVLLSRRTAVTRVHGLNTANVVVQNFIPQGDDLVITAGNYNLSSVMYDKGFIDAHNGVFPSLEKVLANIKPGTSIAYSRRFCVVRDNLGIRWLYRDAARVGIFTGVDTLNLLSKTAFLREEIMEDPAFTLNNIREF